MVAYVDTGIECLILHLPSVAIIKVQQQMEDLLRPSWGRTTLRKEFCRSSTSFCKNHLVSDFLRLYVSKGDR